MKRMNAVRKFGTRAVVGAAAMVGSVAAFADAAAVAGTISGTSADVSTIGWAALGVIAVAAGFKYIRRAV